MSSSNNKVLKDIIDKIVSYDECESVLPQVIQDIVDLLTVAVNEDSLRYYEFPFGKQRMLSMTQIGTSVGLSLTAFLLGDRCFLFIFISNKINLVQLTFYFFLIFTTKKKMNSLE